MKLGIVGKMHDIPEKSLTLSSVERLTNNATSRSVNNTLHVDIFPTKQIYTLNYDVISKEIDDFYNTIYNFQASGEGELQFIKDGKTIRVYMPLPSLGEDLKGEYNYGYTVELQEI